MAGERRRPTVLVLALAAAAVWAWFASGVRTFTRPAEVLTFIPGLAVVLITLVPSLRPRRPATPRPRHRRWSVLPWVALLSAIVGWELLQLFSQPRSAHPTMSSIINDLLSTHPTRFLGYLGWLFLGWLLVRDLRPRDESA